MWTLLLTLAAASVTDRVIAVVDAEVVLASDLTMAEDLRNHANPHGFWSRPDAPIEAALIRAAAGDLALYRPSPTDVQRRISKLKHGFGDDWQPFVQRWSLTPSDLISMVRLRLVTEAWLIRNVTASPTDPERFDAEISVLISTLDRRFRVRRVPVIE